MKKTICIMAILTAVILLFGCANRNETESPLQSASGGSVNTESNTNLKDINITTDGEETVVKLSFLSGSRKAGSTESKLLSVPEYTVEQLSAPERIKITLQNISFWDYQQKDSWALSDFLLGLFQEAPADNDSLIVYLQLSRAAEFTVEDIEEDLVIRLKPMKAQKTKYYYCITNSFNEHQEGTWPGDIDMTPVLCSDLKNKLLISQPFDTMGDAESFRDSINTVLQRALPGSSLSVVDLEAGTLPDYTDISISAEENKSVVMKDEAYASTPLLLQNGRYLAMAGDGTIVFSRSNRTEETAGAQAGYASSDQLWIMDASGRVKGVSISGTMFNTIDSAQFSADSRYICILDVTIENSVLYVYDLITETLWNLGEEGFGTQTAAFAWSDKQNTLYAMTGHDNILQLLSCTFQEEGSPLIQAVEEEPGAAGRLIVSKGVVYFADSAAAVVYRIGDQRTEITAGIDFEVSPDGNAMAVLETKIIENERVLTNLKLCDIVTGKCLEIVDNAEIVSFGFSSNGSTVYYTDAAIGSEAVDGYRFGLFGYDIASEKNEMLALSATGDIAIGETGDIFLMQFIDEASGSFYTTYQYNLG